MYAAAEFSGVTPNKHGGTELQHIKALRAMGAEVPEDDNEIPVQLAYLYGLFKSIKFAKIPNDDGFSLASKGQISYNEVKIYSELTGLELEAFEVDVILSLEAIFERALN